MPPKFAIEVIRNGIKTNTLKCYESLNATFQRWRKRAGIDSESEAFAQYCERHKNSEKELGSMATLFYAIKKADCLHGGSAWVHEPWTSDFIKGLKYQGGRAEYHKVRLGLTLEMQRELVKEATDAGEQELATGYEVLFRSLVRHGHIPRLMRDEIHFVETPGGPATDFAKIWMTGFKGKEDDAKGQWVKLIGMNTRLKDHIARLPKRGNENALFPGWDERLAVNFMQRTAHKCRWPAGFKFDVQCLRVGGSQEQELAGVPVEDIRIQGRWAKGGAYNKHYRPMAAPLQTLVKLEPRNAPRVRRGKRSRASIDDEPPCHESIDERKAEFSNAARLTRSKEYEDRTGGRIRLLF